MRRVAYAAVTMTAAAGGAIAAPSTISPFQYVAPVQGDLTPDIPVRVPLPQDLLSAARPDCADVRLFDDTDHEIPFVIYEQTEAPRARSSFQFQVVAYEKSGDTEEITVRRPRHTPPFRSIELVVNGADFKKRVRVDAGSGPDTFEQIATDTIFDFSSRLDLRRTAIDLPETDAETLRLVLRDDARPATESPELRLRYEGLEFWASGVNTSPFRVDRILGWTGERKAPEHYYDSHVLSSPETTVEEDGNTLVNLDVRLPAASFTLNVENPYYYRRIEILAADKNDRDDAFRVASSGVIFKVPGMTESENTIRFDHPTAHFKLRVLNEDNPPLRVRSVELAWVRRNLYFVPEAERDYRVYVGSDVVNRPRYELGRLIPSDHAKLRQYAAGSLASLAANASYDPAPRPETREAAEKAVFVGLVVVLVCGLGLWAFRLMKRMPEQAGD